MRAFIIIALLAVLGAAAFPLPDDISCYDGSIPFSDINAPEQPATNGSACNCLSFAYWDSTNGYCNPGCESIAHSNGQSYDTVANTGSCVCAPPAYNYNANTGLCEINCGMVDNTLNTDTNPDGSCTCATYAYEWDPNAATCGLNCVLVGNSTGPGVNGDCACADKFMYNTSSSMCYVDCNSIPNTNVAGGPSAQPDNLTCVCANSYTWNASALTCDFDCTTVNNSNGTVGSSCSCSLPYSFIPNPLPVCAVNCSLIDNTTTVGTVSDGICTCVAPLVWNSSTLTCNLDCGVIPNANGTVNSTACSCSNQYSWNSTNSSCTINCTDIIGSTGQATDASTC